MSIEQLITEHLDIWTAADTEKKSGRGRSSGSAGSVYGIKKLRELILELAVRGKLVPQDANDEPASELLKRIAAEKVKLVAEGKIKKDKSLAPVSDGEKLFELPQGWEWAKFPELYFFQEGPGIRNWQFRTEGVKLLNVQNIVKGQLVLDNSDKHIDPDEYIEKYLHFTIKEGDLLFASSGGSWGKTAFFSDPGFKVIVNTSTIRMHPYFDICSRFYLRIFVDSISFVNQMVVQLVGMQPNFGSTHLSKITLAIPPIAEQHRIVAKVVEIMAICEQLEKQHNNAAEAHEKLVNHLLGKLTQSQNAEDFNTQWQRISEHFDTLFTTEASIDALKQTLLQLAVMGKLVPQDPNDEPASELLKRIQAEKAKLIAEGKIKKDKPLAAISDEEKPFELPVGWEWARLSELIAGMDSGWSPACLENKSPSDNVWGVLKTTAVQIMQYLEQENKELPDKLTPRPEAEAKVGDILFTRAGPTNRVAISCLVEATRKKLMISDKIIRFHPIEMGIDGHFLVLCLNTGATAAYLEKAKSGMAASQVNISQEKLRSAPIPLPPLKIQKLIVSKVVEMTAICDHLKGRLTESNELQQKLADTLVEQVI